MAIEIRLPNITGATEKEQLLQLKSYLYQLSEQLQWAFDNIDTTAGSGNGSYVVNQAPRVVTSSSGSSSGNAGVSFAELKSLIIKSSDIVDAYYEEINKRIEGLYVTQSDFGTYVEQTSLEIEANSTGIKQNYEDVQTIITNTHTLSGRIDVAYDRIDETNGNVSTLGEGLDTANSRIDGVDDAFQSYKTNTSNEIQNITNSISTVDQLRLAAEEELRGGLQSVGNVLTMLTGIILEEGGVVTIGTTGTIKSGLLYTNSDGVAVYGLEVGQNIKINGTDVYSKIARLTSQGLYFFNPESYDPSLSDENNAVAYISDKKLYIGQAEILTSLKIGKIVDYVLTNGDVVTKWEGG